MNVRVKMTSDYLPHHCTTTYVHTTNLHTIIIYHCKGVNTFNYRFYGFCNKNHIHYKLTGTSSDCFELRFFALKLHIGHRNIWVRKVRSESCKVIWLESRACAIAFVKYRHFKRQIILPTFTVSI